MRSTVSPVNMYKFSALQGFGWDGGSGGGKIEAIIIEEQQQKCILKLHYKIF